jgi:hypothetical protein
VRRWRALIHPLCAAVFGPFILAGLVVLVLDGHWLSWFSGVVAGACAGAWIALREEVPRYVERWRDGADGERRTEKELRPLARCGWRLFHDVQARYGNYDHVAVGRAGVFLLETKNLDGTVELRDGILHQHRRLDPDADTRHGKIRPRALGAAARLKEDIQSRTGHCVWVQAVVVLWPRFPEGLVEDDQCVWIHGTRLPAWMRDQPDRLDQNKVEKIAAAVADIAHHGRLQAAAPGPAQTAAPR